jgi:hypothetical protein
MDPIRTPGFVQMKTSRSTGTKARQPIDHNKFEGLSLALFQESEDGLILFDAITLSILDLNIAAQRLCGMSLRDLLESPISNLLRSPRCEQFGPALFPGRQARLPHASWAFELKTNQSSVWLPVNLSVTRLILKPHPLLLLRVRAVGHEANDSVDSDHTPLPSYSAPEMKGQSESAADARPLRDRTS